MIPIGGSMAAWLAVAAALVVAAVAFTMAKSARRRAEDLALRLRHSEQRAGGLSAEATIAIRKARTRAEALEAAEELRDDALAAAKRAITSSRELVGNVSHELKTPLTAIRGAAETLHDGALDDPKAGRRFVGRILEQCERLEALLGDLLTLSRLESAGSAGNPREAVDLERLARRVLRTLEPAAQRVDVQLEVDIPGAMQVQGDASALERLFLNLLENAVKYNRPGGEARLTARLEEGNAVIEVEDVGIGIPDKDRERIFERFYRVDRGRAREQGGSGLGLAIAKRVVEGHGGTIEVESRLGRGAVFRVCLPQAPASS